ncbi:MAG: hypothetical protein V4689_09505 [Verrucomicrobiota bacterium]
MKKLLQRAWLGIAIAMLGLALVFVKLRHREIRLDSAPLAPWHHKSDRNEIRQGTGREKRTAVLMLAAEPPSEERDRELLQAVRQWAVGAPHDAMTWAGKSPAGEWRDWLMCAVITETASIDVPKAIATLDTQLFTSGLPRDHAIVAIAQRWAQTAPNKAREWAERLEGDAAREDALREIAVIEQAR